MAPTILQVMRGVETRLATITGLRVNDLVPDQINPPAAIVGVPPVPEYHTTMANGKFRVDLTVTVMVSAVLDRIGQEKLAGYVNPTGSTSIKAAVEADRTLGGVVDDCVVMSFRPFGLDEVGLIGYYGGTFTLIAVASGT